jgi:hypothetical protein
MGTSFGFEGYTTCLPSRQQAHSPSQSAGGTRVPQFNGLTFPGVVNCTHRQPPTHYLSPSGFPCQAGIPRQYPPFNFPFSTKLAPSSKRTCCSDSGEISSARDPLARVHCRTCRAHCPTLPTIATKNLT